MGALQDMLAAKKKDMEELAKKGAGIPPKQEASNVATGMQSSAESTNPMPTPPVPVKGKVDPVKAAAALAVYEDRDVRPLRAIIRSRGGKTLAIAGFFYAKDEDDVKILDSYAERGSVKKLDFSENKEEKKEEGKK